MLEIALGLAKQSPVKEVREFEQSLVTGPLAATGER